MSDKNTFIHGYALIVGVGNYKHSILSVPVTAQDAEDLGQILVDPRFCAYPESQVMILTNEGANRTRILAELDVIKDKVEEDKNSTVVIFFSGHGWQQGDYYFLPYETEVQDINGRPSVRLDTVLANKDFIDKVRKIPAQRLIVLFNTCFAGGVGTALSPEIEQLSQFSPVPLSLFEELLTGSGRVIISSSLASERSWIKGGAKHSLFVEQLMAGLRGEGITTNQDTIRVFDLFEHLSASVPMDARTIGVTQTPVLKAYDLTQDFPVALLMGGQGLSPSAVKLAEQKLSYNNAKIRRLLTEAFTDEDLNDFCMDYFPRVFEQLSTGMSKSQKIQRLMEYCARRNQFSHLLALVKDSNANKYTEYENELTTI
jgi:hypothetical protein